MDPFIGQIILFAGNFAPKGWATCDGQLLSIASNTALFSILGTTYGGDGRTTFGLPDLRGRAAIHAGQGPGLTSRSLGSKSGAETVTLNATQMPVHNHTVACDANRGNEATPQGNFPAGNVDTYEAVSNASMAATTIGEAGGGLAHENMQPFLTLNYIIALSGIYPSRN